MLLSTGIENELNLDCQHQSKESWSHFCFKCGCIWIRNYETGIKTQSIKYKHFNYSSEIPPLELFNNIEKSIGYKSYFKRIKTNMSEFYRKARILCVKYIKKLTEEYGFTSKTFVAAVLYLDLIYLNYDYYTILKDFKSELMAVGCFLIAGNLFI